MMMLKMMMMMMMMSSGQHSATTGYSSIELPGTGADRAKCTL